MLDRDYHLAEYMPDTEVRLNGEEQRIVNELYNALLIEPDLLKFILANYVSKRSESLRDF